MAQSDRKEAMKQPKGREEIKKDSAVIVGHHSSLSVARRRGRLDIFFPQRRLWWPISMDHVREEKNSQKDSAAWIFTWCVCCMWRTYICMGGCFKWLNWASFRRRAGPWPFCCFSTNIPPELGCCVKGKDTPYFGEKKKCSCLQTNRLLPETFQRKYN